MPKTQAEPFHFEQSLEALNKLVEEMEKGDLPLEKSLALFEQGVALTKDCQKALSAAQQKVNILLEKQGKLSLEPFELDDEVE